MALMKSLNLAFGGVKADGCLSRTLGCIQTCIEIEKLRIRGERFLRSSILQELACFKENIYFPHLKLIYCFLKNIIYDDLGWF